METVMERQESARMVWFGVGHKAKAKRPAAGLLLVCRETGRVLLNKRAGWMAAGGQWSTPGGVADAEDEGDLRVTAFREFAEEMGVWLEFSDCEFVTEYTTFDHRRSYTVYVATVDYEFDCYVDEDETVDYDWFEIDTAIDMNIHHKLRPVLKDFR